MSSDLLPGSSTAGVITFPPLNSKQGLTLHFKGSSENYDIGDYRTLAWVFSW